MVALLALQDETWLPLDIEPVPCIVGDDPCPEDVPITVEALPLPDTVAPEDWEELDPAYELNQEPPEAPLLLAVVKAL